MNISRSYVVVTSDVLVPGSELLVDLHLLDLTKSDSKEDDEKSDECVLDLSVSADDHLWHRSVWKIELDKTPKSEFCIFIVDVLLNYSYLTLQASPKHWESWLV